MRASSVACPVCGTSLRGHPMTGYRCVRCHAFYGTRHVRAIRREQFRDLVREHFSKIPLPLAEPRKTTQIVDADMIIEDQHHDVERALSQAKIAAAAAAQHLDDFVDGAKQVKQERAAIEQVAGTLPIERLRHEPAARAYKAKEILVRAGKHKAKRRVAKKIQRVVTRKRAVVRRRVKKALAKKRVTRRRR